MALFELLVPGVGENKSIICPSAAPRGTFWTADIAVATTADGQITGKLADNLDRDLIGFNGRPITLTGLRSFEDIQFNAGLEGPDKAGQEVSLWPPPELMAIEDEATHIHIDQTNPITALGDLVNFDDGHVRIAQSGEQAFYKVVGIEAGVEDPAQFRYILQRLAAGYKV